MGENAGNVVTVFLESTYNYVQYNVDLIGGANENVRQLLNDIQDLRSSVKEWTKNSDGNESIEKLGDVVRDVIFAAEDAAEKYIVYSSRRIHKRGLSKVLSAFDYVRELRKVGEECIRLRGKIQRLYEIEVPTALNATGSGNFADGFTTDKRRVCLLSKTAVENNIFGFVDAANDVKKLLTGTSEELQVYCIVGMLGLGKTTLARKVYNDPEIIYRFFVRVFVKVSQVYSKKDMLLKILGHFEMITDEMLMLSQETLWEIILEKLNGKQYLIVLDDVWDTGAWDDLKDAFPLNQKRSRVLITTRDSRVARHVSPLVDPYELCCMDFNERKDLLRLKVFGKTGCPKDLETQIQSYEVHILQKSGGLPLAIVVTAGILLDHKFIPEWWNNVHQHVKNFDNVNENRCTELIRFSFTNLPFYMKPCFLYLGVFPEDFDIPVWKLLRLWIAEGFVQGNGNLEDIAERYLEELVNRNLVMVSENRLNGRIKSCRVHDILRDFCKTEATRQNVFQQMEGSSPVNTDISQDEYLRITVNSQVLTYVFSKPTGDSVRSFLTFPEEDINIPQEKISIIPKAFQLLRVLDIRALYLESFPAEIYYLILLKYLAISCGTSILAAKLSYLWNLQTLIIETKSSTLTIKADISQMKQLRHLHTNTSASLQELQQEFSSSLSKSKVQTLSTIAPESCTSVFFERFKDLKKLGVRGNLALYLYPKNGPGFFDHLPRLESLENLKLVNDHVDKELHSLPDDIYFPSTLTRLTLLNTFLDWKHMSTLGKLENLKVLKLKNNAFVNKIWDVKDEGFARLMVLHIGKTDLVQWTASAAQFPVLTTLILKDCADLNSIPRDFANIACLQMIDLQWTSLRVVSSAKSIKELKMEIQRKNEQNPQNEVRSHGFKLLIYPPESPSL